MRYIYILIFAPTLFFAQPFRRALINANSFYYKKNVFVYGFENEKNGAAFKIYKISDDLKKTDSLKIFLSKDKIDNYLEISADTMHHYLNFYFQKANSKNLVTMIRLNDSLRTICTAENIDVTRINRLTSFEDEKYWHRNSVYTVRSSSDSAGKQYYLNKYDVISTLKPFDYKETWQFPLDKKNIHTVHVFYADSEVVMIYATILNGPAHGQWIIKLNAQTGQKIRGKKLNTKGDNRNYLMSDFYYDKKTKDLLIVGNVYSEAQLNYTAGTYNFQTLSKGNTFFFTTIDSLLENVTTDEKVVPIVMSNAKADPKKPALYHVKVKEIIKKGATDYILYCTIYKNSGQELVFAYETGFIMNLSLIEMSPPELSFEKIFSNTFVIPNLVSPDIKDINGKMDIKDIKEFDKLMYSKPLADVEACYGKDDNGNVKWILKKTDAKTSNTTFYNAKIGLKGIESSTLLENSKYNHPNVYKKNKETLILFNYDQSSVSFEVSLKNWY